MSVPESVTRALEEWSSFRGNAEIPFGEVNFKFEGFIAEITPVDLWKEPARGLLEYIKIIRRNDFFEPQQAMIIGVNGKTRMMAVRYAFEGKDAIFLHAVDPTEPGIFISGESTPELNRWRGGYRLDTSNSKAKTTFTMRDSGEGTLTLYPEIIF